MYTKQSIRATGATILGRNCAQIMTVTGHKSFSSVAVYQRVSSKMMGDIITSYTVNNVTTASHATTKYFPIATYATDTKTVQHHLLK